MKIFYKIILLTIIFLTIATPAHGQEKEPPDTPAQTYQQDIRFERLTTEDGLSSNEVLSLLKDGIGFIWIGTFNGLNRYDGHTITVYKNELDNTNSLSSNIIRAIHEDENGILWIATSNGGLNRFDPATQTFSHYLNDPEDPNSLSDNSIISLYGDEDGNLWLGTLNNGLDRFDPATESFTHYPELGDGSIERIAEDNAGNLWIAIFGGGLAKLDQETGEITRFRHKPENPDSLTTDKLRWVYVDTEDNLWIAAHDEGLSRLAQETEDGQTDRFIHYEYIPNNPHGIFEGLITRVFEDSSGMLWVGSNSGLGQFNPQTGQFTHYQHDPNNLNSLSHNVITAFTEDQAGILWIGTLGGGVSIHNPATQRFTRYGHDPDNPNSLGLGAVKAAYLDAAGNIWLGNSNEGVDKIDQNSGQITHYRHDPENPHSLSSDKVFAILEDSSGVLWIGTWGGLEQFDRDSEQFHQLYDARIVTAYEDRAKVMWFGTLDDGLLRFDRETEQFQLFEYDPDPSVNSLSDRAVSAILEDSSGAFWVGTWNGGLNLFDRSTGQARVFRHDPNDPGSLSNDRVEVLYEDQAGRLWITTGNGVNRFDRASETFLHFTDKDGLPDNWTNAILEEVPSDALDGQGVKLWFGTRNGLARFDPQTETFQSYDMSDGLQGDASDRGHTKGPDGQMIFGTESGLTTFYPDQIYPDPYIPSVVLTNLKLLNQTVPTGGDSPLQEAIWETEHLPLSYDDRIITFEFASLSYANPADNLLQYKMEGFDDDWSPAGTHHSATYTNLDPGDYVFRVRGSNSDGVWNEEGAALSITITPPWWGTWWFRGLLLVLLAVAIYGGYQWRVRSYKAHSRELEQEVADKTSELQEEIIEHEGTEQRLRKVRDELETLLEVSQDVVATLDLDSLLKTIIRQLDQVIDYDAASIHLLGDGGMEMKFYQNNQILGVSPPQYFLYGEIPAFQEMMDEKKGIIIPDLQKETGLMTAIIAKSGTEFVGIPTNVHCLMFAPMIIRNKGMGMLVVASASPDTYDQESLNLLQIFANQAAIAIENAQLYDEAQAAAVTEERNRLARDLHDSVTQSLYSASLMAEVLPGIWQRAPDEAAQGLEELRLLTRGALAEMRTMLLELRPETLLKTPLGDLIEQLVEVSTSRMELEAQLDIQPVPDLPPEVHINYYRVAQEALNNVTKHSGANHLYVRLAAAPTYTPDDWRGEIELVIRDNGRGFDPDQVPPESLGLGIMYERARDIDAFLTINSQPTEGTSVIFLWKNGEYDD